MDPIWSCNNIFLIPVGYDFGFEDNQILYLFYSPLAGQCVLVTKEDAEKIYDDLRNGTLEKKYQSMTHYLFPSQKKGYHVDCNDYTKMYVLLNQKCNFSCSYCYSAAGRSNQELSMSQIKTMFDYFFFEIPPAEKKRKIVFAGGGEPFLSWNLLKETVRYAEECAISTGQRVSFSSFTNTSILDEEKIRFILEHNVLINSSFDILPKIQESQRDKYDLVSANLKKMLESGIRVNIAATITSSAIPEMERMIQEVITHYPGVEGVNLEMVFDSRTMHDRESTICYFLNFYNSYISAEKLARKNNLHLYNSFFYLRNIIRDRYCGGAFVLTADGKLSSCPYVSTPKDPGYQIMSYGECNNGKVVIDKNKLSAFLSVKAENKPECRNCFAKWNCGGGCPNSLSLYTSEVRTAICENTRLYLKKELLRKLEEDFQNVHHKALCDHLHTELKTK